MSITQLSMTGRRDFLKSTGAFLLGFVLAPKQGRLFGANAPASEAVVNSWIRIGADNFITVFIGGGEMGQGIYTGLAQGAAEELMVDWEVLLWNQSQQELPG